MEKLANLVSPIIILVFVQIISLFFSCKKESVLNGDCNFLSFSVPGATSSDVDRVNRKIVAYLDDTLSRKNLSIIFQLSPKAKAYYNNSELNSTLSRLDLSNPIQVNVIAEDGSISQWNISAESNYDQIGLGKVSYSRSVRTLYNWYIDQGSSGPTKLSDGGPVCIAMALQ